MNNMPDNQSLQRIEPMPSMAAEPTTPQALMRRATDVAGVCREIVLKTACTIQGRKFVKVEGWESIATAHGCFVGAEDAKRAYDKEGNCIGYEAKSVMRNAHGEIIATGEGFVGFDEKGRDGKPTWKNRAEYAGRAMAQTRAISRVCRSVFAHVVVLIDAGLSTTPAEEVPEGGFDDDLRAANAKPVTPRQAQERPRTSAKPVEPPKATATEEQRLRWIKTLKPLGQAALDYCYERAWLIPPSGPPDDITPGEPIETLKAEHVPATKRAADEILAEIEARMDGAGTPQEGIQGEFDADEPENASQEAASDEESGSGASEDGTETTHGLLETVSIKEGRSAKGKWTRYGIKVGTAWFSTFDKKLGELAKQDEGHMVRVLYKAGDRGNDLLSIEKA